jgi:hypothetical protein
LAHIIDLPDFRIFGRRLAIPFGCSIRPAVLLRVLAHCEVSTCARTGEEIAFKNEAAQSHQNYCSLLFVCVNYWNSISAAVCLSFTASASRWRRRSRCGPLENHALPKPVCLGAA